MTLKKSFLARLLENGKRRIWLLVVSLLVFVLAIPTFVAMEISALSQDEYLIEEGRVAKELYQFADGMYSSSNVFLFILVAMFAVASAIQGFSYLYDRNKIDFYHSKPVSAATRFAVIWTNGILIWLLPYIVGMLLNLVFFAANGILDVKLFGAAWLYLVLAAGLYLCVYHLSILALMMTGKTGVTFMGVMVFLLYELIVRFLLAAYCGKFYRFYFVKNETEWMLPFLSPISYLYRYATKDWSLFTALLCLTLFAAGVLALAYWCYKKRPVELAGSAMTFSAVKPIIKIGIAIPVGLVVGLFTCEIVNYEPLSKSGSPGFPLFIGTLGILFTCCLIQVIYEADIKGMFHKKSHIVISLVLAMCVAFVFRFDLTGVDTKIPDMEDIEYATVLTEGNYRYGRNYLDDDLQWINKEEYVDKYMRLTGEEAKAARDLMAYSMHLNLEQTEKDYEAGYDYRYVTFGFRLKNGIMFYRSVPVAMREAESKAYIEIIENAEAFIVANEVGMSEELKEVVDGNEWSVKAYWDNWVNSKQLSRKQARELLEYYRLDLMNQNYQIKTSELPIGTFQIHIDAKVSYTSILDLEIYPSYTNCVKYLKEIGVETEKYVSIEDVDIIVVTRCLNNEVDYVDKASMESILANIYPEYMNLDHWYMDYPAEEDYSVRIIFKSDSEPAMDYDTVIDFSFYKDQVPEFVNKDLDKAKANKEEIANKMK